MRILVWSVYVSLLMCSSSHKMHFCWFYVYLQIESNVCQLSRHLRFVWLESRRKNNEWWRHIFAVIQLIVTEIQHSCIEIKVPSTYFIKRINNGARLSVRMWFYVWKMYTCNIIVYAFMFKVATLTNILLNHFNSHYVT